MWRMILGLEDPSSSSTLSVELAVGAPITGEGDRSLFEGGGGGTSPVLGVPGGVDGTVGEGEAVPGGKVLGGEGGDAVDLVL